MSSAPHPAYVKGHGTGNDFLLFADPDNHYWLNAEQVAALTDRNAGIGADGIIRAVLVETAGALLTGVATGQAQWFMDDRNADRSIAATCGTGIRVFVAFLLDEGLLELRDGAVVAVATRAGEMIVRREGDEFAVDMGPWSAPGGAEALQAGSDVVVELGGFRAPRP